MLRTTILALSVACLPLPTLADGHAQAEKAMTAFEGVFGVTKGKRRNHTKGYCITGSFIPQDKDILNYTNSSIFKGVSTVNGRLSHKGGKNNPPDNKFADYGLAFELETSDGDAHIINMNTEHFFPVSTTEAFIALMHAKATDKAAAAEIARNSQEIQVHKAYHDARDKTLVPYEGATYNSINSFYLVDEAGKKTAIRWAFVPSGEHGLAMEPRENFFLDNIQANLAKGEVSWDMVISLAAEGDDINNPAVKWSDDNTKIVAAKLKVTAAVAEADGTCDEVNFDPTVLSEGFEPSEDPMLQARAAIYALGVSKRVSEK